MLIDDNCSARPLRVLAGSYGVTPGFAENGMARRTCRALPPFLASNPSGIALADNRVENAND